MGFSGGVFRGLQRRAAKRAKRRETSAEKQSVLHCSRQGKFRMVQDVTGNANCAGSHCVIPSSWLTVSRSRHGIIAGNSVEHGFGGAIGCLRVRGWGAAYPGSRSLGR